MPSSSSSDPDNEPGTNWLINLLFDSWVPIILVIVSYFLYQHFKSYKKFAKSSI